MELCEEIQLPSSEMIASTILTALKHSENTKLFCEHLVFCNKVFPRKININKFFAGSFVEERFSEELNKLGFNCENIAEQENKVDLVINKIKFSIKSVSSIKSDIILNNHRGESKIISEIQPTFLFIIEEKEVTIAFIDQAMLVGTGYTHKIIKNSHACATLSGRFVKYLIEKEMEPENVLKVRIGELPKITPVLARCFINEFVKSQFEKARTEQRDEQHLHSQSSQDVCTRSDPSHEECESQENSVVSHTHEESDSDAPDHK
jgi:hypothetical protein